MGGFETGPVKEIQAEIAEIISPRCLIGQLAVRPERQPYMVTCPDGAQVELVFDAASFLARGMNKPRRARRLFEMEKAGLGSSRYRLFHSRLLAFTRRALVKNPSAPLALAPLHKVAPPVISARFDAVIAQGRIVIAKPELKNFHKLRIQFKRLRYACEFVSSAYGDALHAFIGETVKIQDCLGDLQDTVCTRSLIDRLLREWKGSILAPRLIFMMGEMYELQREIARLKQTEFQEIWKRFDQEATRKTLLSALMRD